MCQWNESQNEQTHGHSDKVCSNGVEHYDDGSELYDASNLGGLQVLNISPEPIFQREYIDDTLGDGKHLEVGISVCWPEIFASEATN